MKPGICASIAAAMLTIATSSALAEDTAATAPAARGAMPPGGNRPALVGGALPGGAVLSARTACLRPEAGGQELTAAIGADGSFRFGQLRPGRYALALRSAAIGRQTQATSFGERAAASPCAVPGAEGGPAAAVSSVGSLAGGHGGGAASAAYARTGYGAMPNRISMNVTVGRRTTAADLDGEAITVEVGADGVLSGSAMAGASATGAPADH